MFWLLLTWLAAPIIWLRIRLTTKNRLCPRRVLVVQIAKIGDFVNSTAVFRGVRASLPQTHITALIHPINQPLAHRLDSIDAVITLPANGFRGWRGKLWFYRLLCGRYDAVVTLSPNLSTLIVPFWASIPFRVSVLPDRRRGIARLAWPFLTHGEPHRSGQLFRETALRALTGLGIAVNEAILALPNEAPISEASRIKAQRLLLDMPRPRVGLGVSAGNPMKSLTPAQLKEIVDIAFASHAGSVILIGTANDRAIAIQLAAHWQNGRVLDATGQTELEELPAILADLDIYMGVDSGATYLADAVGVAVIDFMGPADPSDQRPIGSRAELVLPRVPCAPCSHAFDAPYHCQQHDRICLQSLPMSSLKALLTQKFVSRTS